MWSLSHPANEMLQCRRRVPATRVAQVFCFPKEVSWRIAKPTNLHVCIYIYPYPYPSISIYIYGSKMIKTYYTMFNGGMNFPFPAFSNLFTRSGSGFTSKSLMAELKAEVAGGWGTGGMLRGGEAWQWLPKLRWNRWVFGGWSTWSGRDSKFWGRQSTRLLITDHSLASGLGRTCVVFQKYLYTLTPKNANNFIGWGILLFKGMYWLGMACWSFSARIVRLERQIGDAAYLQPSIRRLAHAKNPVSDGNHKHLWNGQRFLKPDPDDTTDISAVLIFLSEPRSTLDILDDKESSVRPSTCAEQAAIATGCPFHLLRCLSSMDQKNRPPIPRVQPKNHGAVPMSTATSSLFGRYERFPQQNRQKWKVFTGHQSLYSVLCVYLCIWHDG